MSPISTFQRFLLFPGVYWTWFIMLQQDVNTDGLFCCGIEHLYMLTRKSAKLSYANHAGWLIKSDPQ